MACFRQAASHYLQHKPMLSEVYVAIWHHWATMSGVRLLMLEQTGLLKADDIIRCFLLKKGNWILIRISIRVVLSWHLISDYDRNSQCESLGLTGMQNLESFSCNQAALWMVQYVCLPVCHVVGLFITCQNFLASMFVCRFVCLSVSLSVLSNITRERFDIWSPKLVHIWNGSAVPVSNIDKEVGHGTRSPGKKIGQIFKLP